MWNQLKILAVSSKFRTNKYIEPFEVLRSNFRHVQSRFARNLSKNAFCNLCLLVSHFVLKFLEISELSFENNFNLFFSCVGGSDRLEKLSENELIKVFGGQERLDRLDKHFNLVKTNNVTMAIISYGFTTVIKRALERVGLDKYVYFFFIFQNV